MDNSSSSSSSQSSSSSGEIQSPFALLEAVEAAILAVCGMQSYRLGDLTVTYADLGMLRSLRNELQSEVARQQRTRPLVAEADMSGNFE